LNGYHHEIYHASTVASALVLANPGVAVSYLASIVDHGTKSQGVAKASNAVACGWYYPVPYAVRLS
jgi:hypothetical protein